MAKLLQVGVIGANPDGGWARESHIPALQALPGLELAAVAGKTRQSADAAARSFGISKAYGDAAELFRDPDIDLVTIAVTLPAHRELLLAALQAGKHVYCEYPLGLDVQESRGWPRLRTRPEFTPPSAFRRGPTRPCAGRRSFWRPTPSGVR